MPRISFVLKPVLCNRFENWLESSGIEYHLTKRVLRTGVHVQILLSEEESRVDQVSRAALHLGANCDIRTDEHLSPFHADVGDVPFDGINGCENPLIDYD